MAQLSVFNVFALLVVVVAAEAFAAVSAQEAPAPAPAPMDAGSGFSLPVSGAVVGVSLLVSLMGLLKH